MDVSYACTHIHVFLITPVKLKVIVKGGVYS
jgi:hypothetical protein